MSLSNSDNKLILEGLNDSTYRLSALENWYGSGKIKLTVSDQNLSAEAFINVIVTEVNDPVDTTNVPDSLVIDMDESNVLSLYDIIKDIDTPDSLLTYRFESSHSQLSWQFNPETGEIEFFWDENGKAIEIKTNLNTKMVINDNVVEVAFTIIIIDTDGKETRLVINLTFKNYTGINDLTEIPDTYLLNQNYPNPFNPLTTIEFGVPEECKVKIEVFNILGESVKVLTDNEFSAGYYKLTWNAADVPSGIYFYRILTEKFVETKKMLLLK